MLRSSLIDEIRWISTRRENGSLHQDAIRGTLLDAHKIESLIVDAPTQMPAMLRQVLLPVMLGALGLPGDEQEWSLRFSAGRFSSAEREKIDNYLDEHRDRFNLFDDKAPFCQVADLRSDKGQTKGSALLVATAAQGNNVPLFASRTEADPLPLTPAEAARWLLHAQCWDTAAIKTGAVGDPAARSGKTTGNATGPLGGLGVVMPVGGTLYQTLLLNTPIGSPTSQGSPQWARDLAGPAWGQRAPDGLLDLWTWQSRRIRLIPEETPDGPRVTRVVLCAGDRLQSLPEWEPHTAWGFRKAAKGLTERRPRRHIPGRAIWRGLDALLSLEPPAQGQEGYETSLLLSQFHDLRGELPSDFPLRVETYGIVYGTQSAVIEDIIHDAMPLTVSAFTSASPARGFLLDVTHQAEELAQAVNRLSADLRRATGADPIPWDKGQRSGELVLHALDPFVRRVLLGVRKDPEDTDLLEKGQLAWETVAWEKAQQVADSLFAVQPASAFLGRETVQNERSVAYRPGAADAHFRRQLARILPRAADARKARYAVSTTGA